MKAILEIPNVLHEEKHCEDFLDCVEIYMKYLTKYGKQLGICYGQNSLKKFPISGEFINECENGYVEIVK
ncbi:conserved lipothrixviral structural protein [Sulfolobus islandicus filamentous virus 2]|uniref:Conserved lipothrixviral structural protein n=1 Tax=Sulfolobus islandicus filamentous virus 2 TaxID=1902331 RepID=A0A1D8BJ72_SIFV|nr:conserved lipothrixviral structural protein [Sulfolobus islandicus filamentous virus 2]